MAWSSQSNKHGESWTREELILAFALYCRIPFRKTKANNPEVIELARSLGRTPASVARKLGNFGSFDPELSKRNISGLTHTSKLDREIWNEFHNDWNSLVIEAERLKPTTIAQDYPREENDMEIDRPCGPSEREIVWKTRVHQAFFRESVLSSYEDTCCVTGLRVRECLIASHIVPWSRAEEHRTDPRNGLCLSATFDRLFDRGLVTISPDLRILISERLRDQDDERIRAMISAYHGQEIIRPLRFLPLPDFLQWHSDHVFDRRSL